MAFKMKGFNPGKGTGIGNGFPSEHIEFNTNVRPGNEEFYSSSNVEGMGGATVDNETREDIKKKKKDSETNEMMFEDLTNRLEQYKDDPFKVEVGPAQAYEKGGTKGMFREWLKSMNPKQIKQLKDDGVLPYNYDHKKNYNFTKGTKLARLYDKKINEAINIDNDLKMSADQGYGFNEEQLQDYGIYGMEDFGGKDNKVTTSLDDYAPNPQMAGNIERNQANLDEIKRQENAERRFNFAKNNLDRSIRQGYTPTRSTIKAIKETDPEYYESVLKPYLNMDKKQEKSWDNAWADSEVYDADKGGGIRAWERHLNPQKLKDTKEPIRPGQSVSVDTPTQEDDAILADMDKMIAEQEQEQTIETPVEEVAIGGGEGENIVEETETKEQEFDPKDYNKDGVVDYLDKRMGPPKTNSAYAKWNNKNLENMAKQTLMNADVNPFKFGSKEHEEYTNNKSKAKGLAIKQRYNKFL